MNSARDDQIIRRYQDEDTPSLATIGKEFGLTKERVRQIVKARGLSRTRPTKPSAASRAAQAVIQAEGQLSIAEASRQFGSHSSNVGVYLKQHHPGFDYISLRRQVVGSRTDHGTRNRYSNMGCRCAECRAANAQTTVVLPVDVFEKMRHEVDSVRAWATKALREAAQV